MNILNTIIFNRREKEKENIYINLKTKKELPHRKKLFTHFYQNYPVKQNVIAFVK
jgi:hypothetical protein